LGGNGHGYNAARKGMGQGASRGRTILYDSAIEFSDPIHLLDYSTSRFRIVNSRTEKVSREEPEFKDLSLITLASCFFPRLLGVSNTFDFAAHHAPGIQQSKEGGKKERKPCMKTLTKSTPLICLKLALDVYFSPSEDSQASIVRVQHRRYLNSKGCLRSTASKHQSRPIGPLCA
jgi:hypothetical protein